MYKFKFRDVLPKIPSVTTIHMFEEIIFRVLVEVVPNVNPSDVNVELWTNQRDRSRPDGKWHAMVLPYRGCHSETVHVFGERSVVVAATNFEFTFRARANSEEEWSWFEDGEEKGKCHVEPPRSQEQFSQSLKVPDFSTVVGPLNIGNEFAARDAVSHGFTDLLCLAAEMGEPDYDKNGINCCKIPMRPGIENPIIEDQINEAVSWIKKNLRNQRKMLVYSKHGFSRAGSIILAFVMSEHPSMTYEDALEHLVKRRPVFPHVGIKKTILRLYNQKTPTTAIPIASIPQSVGLQTST